MSTLKYAMSVTGLYTAQVAGAATDWWIVAFACVLSISLAANFFGLMWSVWRELHVRMLNDTVIEALRNAGEALSGIRGSLAEVCKRIDNHHDISTDAKREIHDSIDRVERNIDSRIQTLANLVNRSGVRENVINVKGNAQFNDDDGVQK